MWRSDIVAAARFITADYQQPHVTPNGPAESHCTKQESTASLCEDGENVTNRQPLDTFTRFNDLPSEIRGLIWEATLPPRRIFHVRGSITIYPEQGWPSLKRFLFHIQHRHPVATQVCRESRAAALRRGFFFPKCPDVWFNPDRDMLYVDRNQRRLIQSQGGDPVYRVEGLERVKHLGIEWRAWFRDIPALQSEESMRGRWKYALRSVNLYMPNLESINFVLPQTRYCGGMSFGREPYGAWEHPCKLVTLPANINVPWGKTLPPGAPLTDPALAVSFGRQLTTRLTTWETIRGQMVDALEDDDEAAKEEEGEETDELGHVLPRPGGQIPRVVGWWLLRVGDGTSYNNQEVRTFTS